jgi:hypothetical protein
MGGTSMDQLLVGARLILNGKSTMARGRFAKVAEDGDERGLYGGWWGPVMIFWGRLELVAQVLKASSSPSHQPRQKAVRGSMLGGLASHFVSISVFIRPPQCVNGKGLTI